MIANENIFSPNSTPTIDPVKVGKSTYMRYLARTAAFPLPNAFKVPICNRSSSTILVIAVRQTNAATRKNMIGSNFPKLVIRSASFSKLTHDAIDSLPKTYHCGTRIRSLIPGNCAAKLFQ